MTIDPRILFFDNLAEGWDDEDPDPQSAIDRLERIGDLLAFTPGMNVLEVGCGTGKLTAWLAGRVSPGRVRAVDFAPKMVEAAGKKNIDAKFECLDVCRDDLGKGLYDIIFCFHCFPHFRDSAAALHNFAKAMKSTGRLIVMHLSGSRQINEFHANLEGPVCNDLLPSGEEWDDLLRPAGLRCKELTDREDIFYLEAFLI